MHDKQRCTQGNREQTGPMGRSRHQIHALASIAEELEYLIAKRP